MSKITAVTAGSETGRAAAEAFVGNAETEPAARMRGGAPQADGRFVAEPSMGLGHVRATVYMAGLPLDAGAMFLPAMACDCREAL